MFDLGDAPARFQTAWFLEGVLTQLAVVFVLRARQLPWARTKPAPPVLVAAALAALIGLLFALTPVAAATRCARTC